MAREQRQYTTADLYGPDGRPHAADIRQDEIYNCYLLAPMGALDEQQPDRIRDAVRFNPETGDFTVRLYRPPGAQEREQGRTGPVPESVIVSQDDIRRNIREQGGGTADNNRERNGPLWPTVIEAGFAELYGRDAQGRVDLDRGYRTIGAVTGGGGLADGTYALTGESGRNLQITHSDAPPMRPTGPDHVARPEPPPYQAPRQGARVSLDTAYAEVEQALAGDRPVSMATQGSDVRDGLERSHAYMVTGIARDPLTNEALITLRNPYGTNARAQEGNQHAGTGWNSSSPEITVNLDRLVRDGSFGEFNIGPAPRLPSQQPDAPAPAQGAPASTPPTQPASGAPDPRVSPTQAPTPSGTVDITDRSHPGHERFQQAIGAIERSPNIPPGTFSGERLQQAAANLAYASLAGTERPQGGQNERLDRIDFTVFNRDGTGLVAGQGELGNPASKLAFLPAAQDNATPLGQASQQVGDTLARQQTQAQNMVQPAPMQVIDAPAPKVLSL